MNFLSYHLDQVLLPADRSPLHDPMFKFGIPPLTFDRVHGGHNTTSGFPMFKIPIELFAHVTRFLTRADLKALALADRDCFRLAALSLFNDVQLEVCDSSYQCPIGGQAPSTAFVPHCVRQLTVSSRSNEGELLAKSLTQEIPLQRLSRSIFGVINSSLPNLHILNWDCPGVLHEPDVGTPTVHNSLPLETLSLEVSLPVRPQAQSTDFFGSLFCLVAPTLRQLIWTGPLREDDFLIDSNITAFPNLRSLTLDKISCESDRLLNLFLGKDTKVQSLSIDSSPSTRILFRFRDNIPTLRQLCWINRDADDHFYRDFLTFLDKNSDLETLQIEHPIFPTFMDQSLLPFLQQNFDYLTSLHLVSDAAEFPEQSLRALASLTTLRRLWLSAGNQGFRSTWEVDHTTILQCLSPLHGLEILAFSHDTYTTNVHPLAPRFGDYYSTKALPADLDVSKHLTHAEFELYQGKDVEYNLGITQQITMRRLAWENWHTEQMMEIANAYARTFRALHWCFVGQLVLAPGERTPFSTVGSPPEREPCLSSLRKMMSIAHWRPI
ncbi:hypothetical protein GALMADRAFT_720573 [Galerina marginata CBS 339.88]|uniref:F-box domain-containing protein n=1 Tax=Galerina marginata (strain CBS 339.88) TaxID=685588 RepID=A0A067TQS7_GALM3|nr:hypothetical protein GALMADRAFT_720573 [Galerina marginata CBS 339.88]